MYIYNLVDLLSYSILESDPNKSCLFTISNPLDGRSGKKMSQIQLWNPEKGTLYKQVGYNECLSALAVRNDGRFIAVGTMATGSVIILTAFNLQVCEEWKFINVYFILLVIYS